GPSCPTALSRSGSRAPPAMLSSHCPFDLIDDLHRLRFAVHSHEVEPELARRVRLDSDHHEVEVAVALVVGNLLSDHPGLVFLVHHRELPVRVLDDELLSSPVALGDLAEGHHGASVEIARLWPDGAQ